MGTSPNEAALIFILCLMLNLSLMIIETRSSSKSVFWHFNKNESEVTFLVVKYPEKIASYLLHSGLESMQKRGG